MGTLHVHELVSLDGVVEEPQTWHFPYLDRRMGEVVGAQHASAAVGLLGRRTYEMFASSWGFRTGEMAEAINAAPRLVFSNRLHSADWPGTTLLTGDLAEEVGRLKAEVDGIIGVTGSTTLVRALLAAGLVDRLELLVHPIVLGAGERLFDDSVGRVPMTLVSAETFDTGVQHLVYDVEAA